MTAEIIDFPINTDPSPFKPDAAVRKFLAEIKCNAVVSSRIPWDLKRYLMAEAFESGARFSEHVARILATHVGAQRLHCLLTGVKRQEKAA